MIKEAVSWSFTDQPDVIRMCRELEEAGCVVGLVTRADGAITLVDGRDLDRARRFMTIPEAERFRVFGAWSCAKGDHVAMILKVSPVTVRGYK